MVSKALVTGIVSTAMVVAFTWLGQFTLGNFEDMNSTFSDALAGRTPHVEKTLSDSDIARLAGISEEISSAK